MKIRLLTLTLVLWFAGVAAGRDLESLEPGARVTSKGDQRSYEVLEQTRTGVWVRVPAARGIDDVLAGREAGGDGRIFITRERLEGVEPFAPLPASDEDPNGLVRIVKDDLYTLRRVLRRGDAPELLLPAIRRRAELERLLKRVRDPRLAGYLEDRLSDFDSAREALRAATRAALRERAQGEGIAAAEVYVQLEGLLAEARADESGELQGEIKPLEELLHEVDERVDRQIETGELELLSALVSLPSSPGLEAKRAAADHGRREREEAARERWENAKAWLAADDRRGAEGRRKLALSPLERIEEEFYDRLARRPGPLEGELFGVRAQLGAGPDPSSADVEARARTQELLRIAQTRLRNLYSARLSSDPAQLSQELYARGEAYERALLELSGARGDDYRAALRYMAEVLQEARARRADPPRPIQSSAALDERIQAARAAGLKGLVKQLSAERELARAKGE